VLNVSKSAKYWEKANLSLIIKMLSELHFEELLTFKEVDKVIRKGKTENRFFEERLVLETDNANWTLDVRRSVWGMMLIDEDSVTRDGDAPLEAVQFLLDIQSLIHINDIHLSGFIEEIQQTLYADYICLLNSEAYTAEDLVLMNDIVRQRYLSSHPKALANKGRLGWGKDAIELYAPESAKPIHLHCFAVKKKQPKLGFKIGSLKALFGRKPLVNASGKG